MVRAVILSDRSLREAVEAGRIVIDPFDPGLVQPSSVDVRVDRFFRVFRNHTAGVIDVKQDTRSLTESVEIPDDGVFMLHPGEFVLGSTLERIAVPDDLVGRVEGKALAISTPIPTPDGWTELGDLRVGDVVFSDTGQPTRVKDATEVMLGRPCYEVEFSDGTTLVADASHEWLTRTTAERRRGRRGSLRTTAQLAATLMHGSEYNHQIHLAASVVCRPRKLPVHPYVMGRLLGDGMDATNDRVIPASYLRASVEHRWLLLQGLMDSGGDCDGSGRCALSTTNEHLAEQVRELVASLGCRPVVAKRPAMVDEIDQGPTYDVTFTPNRPVFRIERKARRQRSSRCVQDVRAVCAVRPVPSVPVRCIEVEAITGIFLAGRSFVPTHNSSLGRLGLLIHSTAGFIDAGFDGHITLELANVASLPITLYPGMKIGQVSFMQMTTPAERPYGKGATGSKYQGQRGPTPSRYYENFSR
jgi:deoxycytidine triphosphate deaminase